MKRVSILLLTTVTVVLLGWILVFGELRGHGTKPSGASEEQVTEMRDAGRSSEASDHTPRGEGPALFSARVPVADCAAGVISGEVTDELQEPIVGATLFLHRMPPGPQRGEIGSLVAHVQSDQNGGYRFHGIESGKYRVKTRKPGWVDDWQDVWLGEAGDKIEDLAIRLRTAFPLQGKIMDTEGVGIKAGWIVAAWSSGPHVIDMQAEVRSSSDGSFSFPALPAGRVTLLAWAEGHELALLHVDAASVEPVRLTLCPEGPYRLTFAMLRDRAAGFELPVDATVELAISVEGGTVLLPGPLRRLQLPNEGAVEARGLRAGTYYYAPHCSSLVLTSADDGEELDPDRPEVHIDLGWIQGKALNGKLLDSRGGPVPGVRLELFCESCDSEHVCQTDSRGNWSFPPHHYDHERVHLRLLSPGLRFTKVGIGYDPGEVHPGSPNVLHVAPAVILSGRVVNEKGLAVPEAYVVLHGANLLAGYGAWALSDAQGRFRLTPHREMRPPVFLSAYTPTAYMETPLRLQGDSRRSEDGIRLTLQEGGCIEGMVVDEERVGIPGVLIEAEVEDPTTSRGAMLRALSYNWAISDRDGTFRIQNIPAGRWTLTASAEGRVSPVPSPILDIQANRISSGHRILMARERVITGRLVTKSGKPIKAVDVHARLLGDLVDHGPGTYAETETDREGRFRLIGLRSGSYELEALLLPSHISALGALGVGSKGEIHGWSFKTYRRRASAGGPEFSWTLALPHFGGITARLALPLMPKEDILIQLTRGDTTFSISRRAQSGDLTIHGIQEGTYDFLLTSPWFEDVKREIHVREQVVLDLGLLSPIPARVVTGRISDQDGRFIAGVWIGTDPHLAVEWTTSNQDNGPWQFGGRVLAETDRGGRFRLPLKQGDKIQAFKHGFVPIQAEAPIQGGSSQGIPDVQFAGAAVKTGKLALRLRRAGKLMVESAREPPGGTRSWKLSLVRLPVHPGARKTAWRRTQRLHSPGKCSFLGLEPGRYRLTVAPDRVSKSEERTTPTVWDQEVVRIQAGSKPVVKIR